MRLKVGDRVVCIDAAGCFGNLVHGTQYTIAEISELGGSVRLEGVNDWWSDDRFQYVDTSKNTALHQFPSGAVRGTDASGTRFDLISPIALQALAETYAEGAAKYGDDNWLKGIPSRDLLNHALRHINLWQQGDASEPHLPHAIWNLCAIVHFEKTRPELIERPYAGKGGE